MEWNENVSKKSNAPTMWHLTGTYKLAAKGEIIERNLTKRTGHIIGTIHDPQYRV